MACEATRSNAPSLAMIRLQLTGNAGGCLTLIACSMAYQVLRDGLSAIIGQQSG
jgi:hypothetical protein